MVFGPSYVPRLPSVSSNRKSFHMCVRIPRVLNRESSKLGTVLYRYRAYQLPVQYRVPSQCSLFKSS